MRSPPAVNLTTREAGFLFGITFLCVAAIVVITYATLGARDNRPVADDQLRLPVQLDGVREKG
jgi:hypothetical protein